MERYVPLKETMRFSVCNKSFLLKERLIGLKGKMTNISFN